MLNNNDEEKIIRLPELQAILGISRATAWRWEKMGWLPKRIQLGPRSIGWRRSEVLDHISNLKRA